MRRFATGLLVAISAVALLISCTSLWVRQNVIDTGTFVANAETVMDQPAVEARINERVTQAVMTAPQVKDAIAQGVGLLPPALQRFGPTLTTGAASIVSNGVRTVLTSDPFRPVTRAALSSAQSQLVAGQPVRFSIGQAKALVPAAARTGLAGQVLALIPNDLGVTLLTPGDAPQLYTMIDLLQSVWWWAGALALLALVGALLVARRRRSVLIGFAATTAALTAVVLVALRVAPALLLPKVQPANREAASAVYDVIAASLRSWTLWLGAGALVLLACALLWGHLGLIPAMRRAGARVRTTMAERRAAAATDRAGTDRDGAAPAERESWPRRAATATGLFFSQLALSERSAGLGAFVRAHLVVVRWAGIAVGALLLLLWPSPGIGTLVVVAAVVALYLALVEWLQSRAAPAEAEALVREPAAAPTTAVLAAQPTAVASVPTTPTAPAPQSIAAAAVSTGAESAAPPAEPVATSDRIEPVTRVDPVATPPEPPLPAARPAEPLVPTRVTTEALTTLNERLDLLVRLGDARRAGVLTDEEFDEEKELLLRR